LVKRVKRGRIVRGIAQYRIEVKRGVEPRGKHKKHRKEKRSPS